MLATKRKDTRDYGEGRERLLRAASDMVTAGIDLDVAGVATRAGVSNALVWRHFHNKAGLLAALVNDFYDRYDSAVHDATLLPGATWADRERTRLRQAIEFHLEDRLAPAILSRLGADAAVHAVRSERVERHVRTAAENIRRGQRSGEIPKDLDSDLLAGMIIGGLHQAVARTLDSDATPDVDHLASGLWQAVAAALQINA